MKLEIFEFIEIWNNRKRSYSALNYKKKQEFNIQINYKNGIITNSAVFVLIAGTI